MRNNDKLFLVKSALREEIDPKGLALRASIPYVGGFYTPYYIAKHVKDVPETLLSSAAITAGSLTGGSIGGTLGSIVPVAGNLIGSALGSTAGGALTAMMAADVLNDRTRNKQKGLLPHVIDALKTRPNESINPMMAIMPVVGGPHVAAKTNDPMEAARQSLIANTVGFGTAAAASFDRSYLSSAKHLFDMYRARTWGKKLKSLGKASEVLLKRNVLKLGKKTLAGALLGSIAHTLTTAGLANRYNAKREQGDYDKNLSDKTKALANVIKQRYFS